MRVRQLATIAVAALLLIGGVAAVGAASPADQANDDTDAHDENASDTVGPSGGLPDQVPEHVSAIHDRIASFLDGTIDNLGQALSDLLGNGDAAEDGSDTASDRP